MLKTTGSSEKLAPITFRADNNKIVDSGSSRANETMRNSSRKSTYMPNIRATREPNFLTFDAKKAFNHLWLAFVKTLILQQFDLENHIWIETNVLSYAIGRVLSQLNLNFDASPNDLNKSDFSQWHPIIYFFRKMIPIETK